MNKTYKKVFNARRGKYVAVDETKTGHGQMGTCTVGGHKPAAITAAVVGAVLAMGVNGAIAATTAPQTKTDTADWVIAQGAEIKTEGLASPVNTITVTGSGGTEDVKIGLKTTVTKEQYKVTAKQTTKPTWVFSEEIRGGWGGTKYYDQYGQEQTCSFLSKCNSYTQGPDAVQTEYVFEKVGEVTEVREFAGEYDLLAKNEYKEWAETELVNHNDELLTEQDKVNIAADQVVFVDKYVIPTKETDILGNIVVSVDTDSVEFSDWTKERNVPGSKPILTNNVDGFTINENLTVEAGGQFINEKNINITGFVDINSEGGISSVTNKGATTQMTVGGGVDIESGSMLTNEGIFSTSNINGSGDIVNSGNFTAGSVSAAEIKNNAGSFSASSIDAGKLSIAGGIVTSTGNVSVETNATDEDGNVVALVGQGAVLDVNNNGNLVLGNTSSSSEFVNDGTINVEGKVSLSGQSTGVGYGGVGLADNKTTSLTNSGTIDALALEIVHGVSGLASGFTGFEVSSFTNDVNSDKSKPNATFGSVSVTAGNVVNKGWMQVSGATFLKDDTGGASMGSSLTNQEGAQYDTGSLTVGANSTVTNAGSLNVTDEKAVSNNAGTITNIDTFDVAGSLTNTNSITNTNSFVVDKAFTNNGTFTNGTVDGDNTNVLTQVGTLTGTSADSILNNYGKFEITDAEGASTNAGTITNVGTFDVAGSLTNSKEITNSGTINNQTGGIFTVVGDLTNTGIVDNDGALTVGGNFITSSDGKIDLTVGNNEYDGVVDNTGYITVGGNFELQGDSTLLNNSASGTIFAQGDIVIEGSFNNEGELKVAEGSKIDVGDSIYNITVLPADEINARDIFNGVSVDGTVGAGTMTVVGNLTARDKLQNINGSTLTVGGLISAGTILNTSDFNANGGVKVSGDFSNEVDVAGGHVGDVDIVGNLQVGGTLANAGSFDVTGNVEAGTINNNAGSLNISGNVDVDTFTNTVTNSTVATLTDSEEVKYDVTIGGNLNIGNSFDSDGNVLVSGDTTLTDGSMNNGGLFETSDLIVKNTIDESLEQKSSTVVNTGTLIADSLQIEDQLLGIDLPLVEEGTASFENQRGKVELGSATLLGGSLTNSGEMTITGKTGLPGALDSLLTSELGSTLTGVLTGLIGDETEFGLVQGNGDVTNTDKLTVDGLSINIASDLKNEGASSSMTFNDTLISIGGTITNEGTLSTNGGMDVSSILSNYSVVTDILPSGLSNVNVGYIQTTGTLTNSGIWNSSGALLAGGTVENKDGATATMSGLTVNVGTTINNGGTLNTNGSLDIMGFIPAEFEKYIPAGMDQIDVGYVQFAGKLNNEGTWNSNSVVITGGEVNNNGTIQIGQVGSTTEGHFALFGGELNNNAGASMSVTGTMLNAADIVNDGTLNTTGGINIAGVMSKLVPDFTVPSGLTDIDVGYVQLGGSLTNNNDWNASSIVVAGGTVNNNAELSAGHTIIVGGTFNNGSMNDDGTVNGASASMSGATIVAGGTVNNFGDLSTKGGVDLTGFIPAELEAYLPDSLETVSLGYAQLGGTVNNSGTWDSSSAVVLGGTINNNDTFNIGSNIEAGHLLIGGGAQLNNAEGAVTNVAGTMVVVGTSGVDTVVNNGTMNTTGGIELGGVINKIAPNLNLPDSITNIDIGYVQLGGNVVNNAEWNASSMVIAGGSFVNGDELNAGHAVIFGELTNNADATVNMTGTTIVAGGSIVNNGQLNTTGGIEVGGVVESLTNGSVELPAGLNSIDVGYAQIGGTTTNNNEWNASSVVNVGGSIVNNGQFNADHMVSVDGTLTNAKDKTVELTGTMVNIATSTDKVVLDNAGSLKTEGSVNLNGLAIGEFELPESLANVELGYAQVGGTANNTGDWDVNNALVVGGVINNANELNADKLFAYGSTITNTGNLTANWIAAAGEGQITNGNKLDVDVMGVVGTGFENQAGANATIDSMLAINSTVTNEGKLETVTGVQMPGVAQDGIQQLAEKLGLEISDLDLDQHVELGYAQVGGTMVNKGDWDASNMVAISGTIENVGEKATLDADKLFAYNSTIENSGDLTANWIAAAGEGQITNATGGELDVDVMGVIGTGFENQAGANATIDSMLAINSTVVNDGTLTTVTGVQLPDAVQNGIVALADKLDVDISGLDLDQHAELGYTQVGGSMENNGQWTASNMVAVGGSITNNNSLSTDGIYSVDTNIANNGQLDINGHLVMVDVNSDTAMSNLTNAADKTMTVTGAMTLVGVNMVNKGTLNTGDSTIDGAGSVASELHNLGTWNSTNLGMAGGDLVNEGEDALLNVSGLMTVAGGSVTNEGTMNTTGKVAVDGLDIDVGYLQAAGSMINEGQWNASQIVAFGGTITNMESGVMNNTGMTLVDTDVKNVGQMKVDGHFVMSEVESGDYTKLTNTGTMTVMGAMGLAGVNMVNTGILTTGDGSIDGTAAVASTMLNKGTWNSTNIGILAGDLDNEGSINVTKQMLIAGGDVNNAVNGTITVDGVFGITSGTLNNNGMLNTGDGVIDGTAALDATLNNNEGATWNATNLGLVLGTLNNAGDLNVTKSVSVAGGTFDNVADVTVGEHMLVAGGDVNNAVNGTITVDGVFGITGGTLNNNGLLETGDGVIDGTVALGATLNNNEGATWNATNLSVALGDLNNEGSINVTKQMLIAGGDVNNAVDATITVDGVFGITSGMLNNNGMLNTGDGVIDGAAALDATLNNNEGATWNATNLGLVLGTLNNAGDLNVTKSVSVAGGTLDNVADVTVGEHMLVAGGDVNNAVNGTITVDGVFGITGGTLNNNGLLETGDGVIDGTVALGATLNNNEGATWNATNLSVALGDLNNEGSINVTKQMLIAGGDVSNAVDATITVDGVFGITSGMLNNNGMLNTGDGVIDGTAAAGAILNNNGTWNASNIGVALGTLTNDDTIKTTGHVTLAGGLITNNADAMMTVGGVLGITAGVLTNDGTLVTGNGALDGAVGALAYLNNNGTWNATNLGIGYGVLTNEGTLTASGTTYVGEGGLMINAGEFTSKILGVAEDGEFVNNDAATVGSIFTTAEQAGVDFIVAGKATNNDTLTVLNTAGIAEGGLFENNADFSSKTLSVAGTFINDGTATVTDFGLAGVATNNNIFTVANAAGVAEEGLFTNNADFSAKDMGVAGEFVNNGTTMIGSAITTADEASGNLGVAENGSVINNDKLSVKNTTVVAENASMTNNGTFETLNLGVVGTLNNTDSMTTNGWVAVEGTVALGGSWIANGETFYNDGSIVGNGSLSITNGIGINTTESTFKVGTLNVTGNATMYHGAHSGSDFNGHWAGLYTDEALDKLNTLAGIEVDTKKAEVTLVDGTTIEVEVLKTTQSKDRLVIGETLYADNVNLGTDSTAGTSTFGTGSSVIIDVESLGTDYAFDSNGSKLDVADGAALILNGVAHGGKYNIAKDFVLTAEDENGNSIGMVQNGQWASTGWTGDYLYAPETSGTGLNWKLDLSWSDLTDTNIGDVYVKAELESVADSKLYNAGGWNVIHKNIVDEVLRTALADNQASTMSLRETTVVGSDGFTNKMYGDLFMNHNVDVATKVLVSNSLASVAQNIAVESLALENVTDTMKGIENHASMTNASVKGSNLWANVLGGEHKQDGLKSSGGGSLGYDADDRGFMIGYDIGADAMNARFGFALSYVDGNVSSVGNHLATTGDYNTFGIHGYMNWTPVENVNVIATVGYSRNSAEAEMNLPKLSGWDKYGKATADVDTNIFSAGVRAEKSFTYENVSIVPHAGLRLMAIDVGSYDTKIDGNTAFHNDADTAVIGQLPFGVTVKGEFEKNGWNVKPMADLTFVPQFGDTESQTTVTFPGGTVSDKHVAEFTGDFATSMTLGVEAQKGDYSIGMQLGVTKGQDKTDSSFMAKVRYQF